ncbi:hypothetical protein [Paenibacillus contaminans]|uniref:Uncharacterized protein n=1 Tax=Paenibacillus contaminans TaxID=450362 RepID=A0A329MH40_9BACL|nr:hypothetical protein [Paenibacillus contaminans]RAV19100.1 hypothetical protein DQG23_21395 [Paenibacillus contaminans]
MFRFAVITFLALSGMVGLFDSSVFAYRNETTFSIIRPKTQLFNFSVEEIQSARLKWLCCYGVLLSKDEIKTLVTLLSKINKKDIKPYNGPAPKGGPTRFVITLVSNGKVGFVKNGEYLLVDGGKVYFPEFSEFVDQIRKDKSRFVEGFTD